MFDPGFLDLMPLTVTVQKALPGQYDSVGAVKLSDTILSYRARAEVSQRRITDSNGQVITSTMQVFIAAQEMISPEDKISLPAGLVPNGKQIQAVLPEYDEEALHHMVVYF